MKEDITGATCGALKGLVVGSVYPGVGTLVGAAAGWEIGLISTVAD